jgi:hypothetical protein
MIHTLVKKAEGMGGAIRGLTLDEVATWLEELRDRVESDDSHESIDSFNDLRDHFCKVLMESETQIPAVYAKTISEMFPDTEAETAPISKI